MSPPKDDKHLIEELKRFLLKDFTKHPRLGTNERDLICEECGSRSTLTIPMGVKNALFSCEPCKMRGYGPEDGHLTCNKCNSDMEQVRILRDSEGVRMGVLCPVCSLLRKEDYKRMDKGDIALRCRSCVSFTIIGKNTAIGKELWKKIKAAGIDKKNRRFNIDLTPNQCPRCMSFIEPRPYNAAEAKEVMEKLKKGIKSSKGVQIANEETLNENLSREADHGEGDAGDDELANRLKNAFPAPSSKMSH